mgnify:CR=1 FL=1
MLMQRSGVILLKKNYLLAGSFPMSLIPAHHQLHILVQFSLYYFFFLSGLPPPFTTKILKMKGLY